MTKWVVQVYMADKFSTFFLSNEDRKIMTIRPEMEKGGKWVYTQGARKETDDIRRLVLSNRWWGSRTSYLLMLHSRRLQPSVEGDPEGYSRRYKV
jgi:hypothetical protein